MINIYSVSLVVSLLIIVFFNVFLKNNKLKRITSCVIGCLVPFLVMSLKNIDVGNDIREYLNVYNNCKNYDFLNFSFTGLEKGYLLFCKIFAKIGIPYRAFLAVVYFLLFSSFGLLIYKYSESPFLSLLFLQTLPFYSFFVSGIRQTVAISFCIFAFVSYFSHSKTWLKHLLFTFLVFIAFTMHKSAIICLVFLILFKLQPTRRFYVAISLISFLLFLYSPYIMQAIYATSIGYLIPYAPVEMNGGLSFVMYSSFFWFITICFLKTNGEYYKSFQSSKTRFSHFYVDTKCNGEVNSCFLIILGIAICLQSLVKVNEVFSRINLYYIPFFTIMVPNSLHKLKSKKLQEIIVPFLTAFMLLLAYFLMYRTGSLGMLPYHF